MAEYICTKVSDADRDLPGDATKVEGNIRYLLAILIQRRDDHYSRIHKHFEYHVSRLWRFLVTESGDRETEDPSRPTKNCLQLFNGQTHPRVDGHDWYKGVSIRTIAGRILLYEPWVSEKACRDHEVYVLGHVCKLELYIALKAYATSMMRVMDKIEGNLRTAT